MKAHGQVADYLDGVLGPDDEVAFLDHLAGCPACEDELEDEVALRAREDSLGAAAEPRPDDVPVIPIASRAPAARGRRWVVPAAMLAVAAAIALVWIVARRPGPAAPPSFALASARTLEPRLAYGPAAGYRPYQVARGATAHETIAPDVLARLHRAGDCHGVAVGYTLSGEYERAASAFDRCGDGAGVDADRAALALLRGDPEQALRLTDRVLRAHPDHAPARWNRALALRELGLGLTAAEAFDGLAADAGWGTEARARAAGLRRDLEAMKASWERLEAEGRAMVLGGPVLAADLARRHPGKARVFFHDAVRTAKTRARLDELRPLAAALDGLVGDGLERYVDAAQARLAPARLALLDEYAMMVMNQDAPPAELTGWLARARAAGADDLVLAALIVTNRVGDAPAEVTRLAAATGDPWFELGVLYLQVAQARAGNRISEALELLDRGDPRCAQARLAYRCLQLRFERAAVEHVRYRASSTLALARETMRAAEAIGQWPQRTNAAPYAGDGARYVRDYPLARAFYREAALAQGSCEALRGDAALGAEMAFDEHQLGAARAALLALPVCEGSPSYAQLILEADLAMAGAVIRAPAALRAELAVFDVDGDPLTAAYLTARLDSLTDPTAIERLRQVAHTARAARDHDSTAERVSMAAATAAMAAAGSRGDWPGVLAIAAETSGVPAPARCALVVAADDARAVTVAVGADGSIEGGFDAATPRPIGAWLAPAPLRARLRGCPVVDVLTTPSWFGVLPLLAPDQPWRYLLRPARAPSAPPAKRVIIAASAPPASLHLAPLAAWSGPVPPGTVLLTGAAATPERVAAELRDATIIEFHVHTERVPESDAPALALSPGSAGWALTAEAIARLELTNAPVVILADCAGAEPARYSHAIWGLPKAFLAAGARTVVAPLVPIPDEAAVPVFARIVDDLGRGTPAATAVAARRTEKNPSGPASWIQSLVVLE